MGKILSATLIPTGAVTSDLAYCEWMYHESIEMMHTDDQDVDVQVFVQELIDNFRMLDDEQAECVNVMGEIPGAIHNLPNNAIVVGMNGRPVNIFWYSDDN